jgi:hypothetical protein
MYSDHFYTKLASLESMLTKTLPGIVRALPKEYTAPASGAVQALKDRLMPSLQSSAFSEGVKGLGSLFSGLGTRLRESAPGIVSSLQPAAGGTRPNYAGYVPKPVGDVSTKRMDTSKPAPEAPPALPKTPGKFSSPEQMQAAARLADLEGRFRKSDLGPESKPASPNKTYTDIVDYVSRNQASDLVGLPSQHRAAYDALPEEKRNQITELMKGNSAINAAIRPGTGYESAFADNSFDRGVLSAAEVVNDLTNVPRSVAAGTVGTDKDKLVPNIDTMRNAIGVSEGVENVRREISGLNTDMRRRADADPNYLGSKEHMDSVQRLGQLIALQNAGSSEAARLNMNARDRMPAFDPSMGRWDKTINTLGSLVSMARPDLALLRGVGRFGLNTADVNNADLYGDLLGVLTPSPSGISKAVQTVRNPGKALASLRDMLSAAKKAPLTSAAKATSNVLMSRPVMMAPTIESVIRANMPQQPAAEVPAAQPAASPAVEPSQPSPSIPQFPPLPEASAPATVEPGAAPAPSPSPAYPNGQSGLSDLQRYLLYAGVSLPAVLALTATIKRDNDEDEADK